MRELLDSIGEMKGTEVGTMVDDRIREFETFLSASSEELFKELCYCLLTANFNAKRAMYIQDSMGSEFLTLPEEKLPLRLRELGHRFPNARAGYIAEARKYAPKLKERLESFRTDAEAREWLVENVKGLGMKEASHFLRNVGRKNLAILDFHIIDRLEKHGVVERPKTLSKKNYLAIEEKLAELAELSGLNQAELDLYLWFMETDTILK